MSSPPGEAEQNVRQLSAALPPEWRWLGRSVQAGSAVSGCQVLAHPAMGVALVDVAPCASPRAEARLRAALIDSGFPFAFSGMLPIVHVRVEASSLTLVWPLLEGGFAAQPPLGINRPGWMELVASTLAARPDWSQPEPEPMAARAGAWRLARWGLAGLALGATFLGGLLLGVSTTSLQTELPAAEISAPLPGHFAASPNIAGPLSAVPSPLPVMSAPLRSVPAPLLSVPAPLPVGASPSGTTLGIALAPAPALPSQMDLPALLPGSLPPLPLAELHAEATPAEPLFSRPRQPTTRRLEIDPGCTDAVLRYQQGLAVSWSEMAHVRNGCRTVVRR